MRRKNIFGFFFTLALLHIQAVRYMGPDKTLGFEHSVRLYGYSCVSLRLFREYRVYIFQ